MFQVILSFCFGQNLLSVPPMGWDSKLSFGANVSEQRLKEIADIFQIRGLKAAGYDYFLINDGWQLNERDELNRLIPDFQRFPDGFGPIVDYVHSLGLKAGIYSTSGTKSCLNLPASFGFEEVDAKRFISWNFDYLRYDFCNNPVVDKLWAPDIGDLIIGNVTYLVKDAKLSGGASINWHNLAGDVGDGKGEVLFTVNATEAGSYGMQMYYADSDGYRMFKMQINNEAPVLFVNFNKTKSFDNKDKLLFELGNRTLQQNNNTIRIYFDQTSEQNALYSAQRMSQYIQNSNLVFHISTSGQYNIQNWGKNVSHIWRTTKDYDSNKGDWDAIINDYETNIQFGLKSGHNSYNDPGFLSVGMPGLSKSQQQAQFSLWCAMSAPLIIRADVQTMTDESIQILTNELNIRINQDSLAVQGLRIQNVSDQHIILKPLSDGTVAVVFFNKNAKNAQKFSFNLRQIPNFISIVNKNAFMSAKQYNVQEGWTGQKLVSDGMLQWEVEKQGAAVFVVGVAV